MRICSLSVPRLKHEWNQTVWSVNNLRCGTSALPALPALLRAPAPQGARSISGAGSARTRSDKVEYASTWAWNFVENNPASSTGGARTR
jgi:hypothetical protein